MTRARLVAAVALILAAPPLGKSEGLSEELGRSDVRIRSAAVPVPAGRTVAELALPERLERLGYTRVTRRPSRPGEYFWGSERFWLFRRAQRLDGADHAARLLGLQLEPHGGRIAAGLTGAGEAFSLAERDAFWLEPELLSESLAGDAAPRIPVRLADLPEHAWRAVLAAEDARFFEHHGIDPRGVARAVVANARAGGVAQGGSTITQQLVKMRDLTPQRTLGRKASEAVRALALDATHAKEEILGAYLDHVYLGHVEGVAVHGIGAASRAFFSKPARELTLAESALLAGVIQAPNRLTPVRHPEAARHRRDWVLGRLEALGWESPERVAAARRAAVATRVSAPPPAGAGAFLDWVKDVVAEHAPHRVERQRGVVVETELDPQLQRWAEDAVRDGLARLRREHPALRRAPLGVALLAVDVETGGVLASVGGDPDAGRGGLDRVRLARRQPGSTVKPLLLMSAFERCGSGGPLNPSTRVADEPLTLALPSGNWSPENTDRRYRGVISLREALAESLNVPFVRLAQHCGCEEGIAWDLRRAGLDLPRSPPPAFALGAIEVSPLELARAYTVFATPGDVLTIRPVRRIERPGGRGLEDVPRRATRVVSPDAAYLVTDLLREAAESGTAHAVRLPGLVVAAKTGTSSERRDAWLAGHAESVACVVWVGQDDGRPLELTGAQAAAPIWRQFMERAVPARPPRPLAQPRGVVTWWVDAATGLLVRAENPRAQRELFRAGHEPRRDRWWRYDPDVEIIR